MNTKAKLLAGALCAVVGLSASAGNRAWGTIDYQRNNKSRGAGYIFNLTNVTAAGHACLKPSDITSQYPFPKDWDSSKDRVYITFNPNIADHAWGNSTITIDSIEIVCTNRPYMFAGASGLVALQQGDRSKSMITTTHAAEDVFASNFTGLKFVGAGQGADDAAPDYGGAIHLIGGQLTLSKCSFTNFVAKRAGGAVCGERLEAGTYIEASKFYDNKCDSVNGYGGALYVTQRKGVGNKNAAISACKFVGNSAENGGAVCCYTAINDEEEPIKISLSAGRLNGDTVLEGNTAGYEGGAIFTEGNVLIQGLSTDGNRGVVFRANSAGVAGGAICQTGVEGDVAPTYLAITNYCLFADNVVSNDEQSTSGGAIAVLIPGSRVEIGGNLNIVTFTNNQAWAASGSQALGGAIYTEEGVTNNFNRAKFVNNHVSAGTSWCYGDAVSAASGLTKIDTCVFDCGDDANAKSYGNAIYFDGTEAQLLNSTFRRGKVEAVAARGGSLAVTNCVLVGNGADGDLRLDGDVSATVAYTAYGKIQVDAANGATLTGANNVPNRTASEVYDGETLRLRSDRYNLAACHGLVQTAKDLDKVAYGSQPPGYSMGAYESSCPPIQVGDGVWAMITNGVCTIYGTGATSNTRPLWDYRDFVSDVVVEDGVTGIGANSFDGWRSLRSVEFGADCTSVGSQAFLECFNLTNVTSKASKAVSFGDHAFYRCNSLESMNFGVMPTFGTQAYTLQAGIYMKDGLPQVYSIPDIQIGGTSKRYVYGTVELGTKADWVDVTNMSDEDRKAYYFFKIVVK